MIAFRSRSSIAGLIAFTALALFSGCASPVPGNGSLSALSGKSLQVKLVFRGQVNPNYFYYFLINNSNNTSAPGPVPVGAPVSGTTYGNGFATGSDLRSGGFTDFVLYSLQQYPGAQPASNFALYHVQDGTDANVRSNFKFNGIPVQYVPPQPPSYNTIYFQIDLAQLFAYPGSPDNQSQAVAAAISQRYMQVNVVATNATPVDTQTSIIKEFDSFGNDVDGRGNFLFVDLGQTAYFNGDTVLSAAATEPPDNDVFISPPGSTGTQDPALDLVDWQIQIVTTNASRTGKQPLKP